jgi:germination protein M
LNNLVYSSVQIEYNIYVDTLPTKPKVKGVIIRMRTNKHIKQRFFLCLILLSVFLLTSCSMNSLFGNNGRNTGFQRPGDELQSFASDLDSWEDGASDDMEIEMTVLLDEESIDAVPAASVVQASSSGSIAGSNITPVQMEIKLYFADRKAVEDGKPGPYGFVTPVTRHIPATSGILCAAMKELIKGPLPEEQGVDPVMPAASEVCKVSIKDGIAYIDFNQSFADNHPGGTLGGSITMQSIVFTASQFDSVDGVLVTVEGQPWDDGHFIWEEPIYADELARSFSKN